MASSLPLPEIVPYHNEEGYPPVNGIDFWGQDRLHVPLPPTRNIMPNPSFEEGLRYWFWTDGGATVPFDRKDPVKKYEIVPEGLFGSHALLFRKEGGGVHIKSFPMQLKKGKTYTLSFYAKTTTGKPSPLTVAISSVSVKGKFSPHFNNFYGDWNSSEAQFEITPEWKRYSRTFVADEYGIHVQISRWKEDFLLDGMQLEEGDQPTKFVTAPVEADFITADNYCQLEPGQPLKAGFIFSGNPGTDADVNVTISNAYREKVYEKHLQVMIGEDGTEKVMIDPDPDQLGQGIFSIRVDIDAGEGVAYTQYFRLTIMDPLSNTHAMKNLFGLNARFLRTDRGEEFARKVMEWGFGFWTYYDPKLPQQEYYYDKYRFAHSMSPATYDPEFEKRTGLSRKSLRDLRQVTPEIEQKVEAFGEYMAKTYPESVSTFTFHNEEEHTCYLPKSGKYDEWFKLQSALARGVRNIRPDAKISPTNGTSGYSSTFGSDAIRGYLKAGQEHGLKYDTVGVHMYFNLDQGSLSVNDLDVEYQRLIDDMNRYGLDPAATVSVTECMNIPWVYIPQWGADQWGDTYRKGNSPTYAIGNREFVHAANAARFWIISMKYWPKVNSVNIWHDPVLDLMLTPQMVCKAANTLGHLMPWVDFYADIRPAGGIRGYSFALEDGTGIAAIWTSNADVENGLNKGPVLQVSFKQPVEFYDMMGNLRSAQSDDKGITRIPLTSAPLFIKAGDVAMLTRSLQAARITDPISALKITMRPDSEGRVVADIENLTGISQKGYLQCDGNKITYDIAPLQTSTYVVLGSDQPVEYDHLYAFGEDYDLISESGEKMKSNWDMEYFYAPKCEGGPDWNRIPKMKMSRRYLEDKKADYPIGYPGDFEADYQVAWSPEALYIRVCIEDDQYCPDIDLWEKAAEKLQRSLWALDAALEVYLDCGANGRSNSIQGYDQDDYRFDFARGADASSGPGFAWRFTEVNWQLAGTVSMPSKADFAREVKPDVEIDGNKIIYTIKLPQRFVEPLKLQTDSLAGLGLHLHDYDMLGGGVRAHKALNNATKDGVHCQFNPQFWPLVYLK